MRTLQVQTPEKVTVSFRLAGLARRMLAFGIDLMLIIALDIVVMLAVGAASIFATLSTVMAILAFFVIHNGYFIITEYLGKGQSPGKKILKIRVKRCNGTQVGFYEIFLRNILRFVDKQPAIYIMGPGLYLVGMITVVLHPHSRRLGDIAAGTVVVHEADIRLDTKQLSFSQKDNPFAGNVALANRLRRTAGLDERNAIFELCIRNDELENSAKAPLFEQYARYCSKRFELEIPQGMSHERFVFCIASLLAVEEK
ncbi:MAG: RDD family protein [Planctomycetota bacterium]|nr:RDD family protein [Planctomycetota bacterium]